MEETGAGVVGEKGWTKSLKGLRKVLAKVSDCAVVPLNETGLSVDTGTLPPFFCFFFLALRLDLTLGLFPSGLTSGPLLNPWVPPPTLFLSSSSTGSTNLNWFRLKLTLCPCFWPPPPPPLFLFLGASLLNLFFLRALMLDFTLGFLPSALRTGGFLKGS